MDNNTSRPAHVPRGSERRKGHRRVEQLRHPGPDRREGERRSWNDRRAED